MSVSNKETQDLYKEASRKNLRFETTKGLIPVEALWDLPLFRDSTSNKVNIGAVVIQCARELKLVKEEAELVGASPSAHQLRVQLKHDIAVDIMKTKEQEHQDLVNKQANHLERTRLMSILKAKQDDSDTNLSIEELQAKIDLLK